MAARSIPADLQLTTVPLTEANVARCEPLWGDRQVCTAREFAQLLTRVRWLLSADRARGAMFVEPGGRLRGFGLATFVREDVATAFIAAPHAQFGRRILLDEDLAAVTLDERGVGYRNASGGLDLVVLSQGFDLAGLTPGKAWQPLAGTSMQAFVDLHRGFNIARIVNEIFGAAGVAFLDRARPATIHRFTVTARSGAPLEAGCWILSRDEAERSGSLILPMFTYSPPIIRFTAAERRVLQAARAGATDERIAGMLRVPVSAVKARWRRIQERAMRLPALRDQIDAVRREHRRGLQWRHFVIDYVRAQPSELTPYYPVSPARRGRVDGRGARHRRRA
jgi:hypothetical protein